MGAVVFPRELSWDPDSRKFLGWVDIAQPSIHDLVSLVSFQAVCL